MFIIVAVGYCSSSGLRGVIDPKYLPEGMSGRWATYKKPLRFLDIQELKCLTKEYYVNKDKKEKSDVHNVILANPKNILNFEINVLGSGSQIDFCMLFDGGLRFYKAKIPGTGARINQNLATQRESLSVVDQMCGYANSIQHSLKTIISSY